MTFAYDPQILAGLGAYRRAAEQASPPPSTPTGGDPDPARWRELRAAREARMQARQETLPAHREVTRVDYKITTFDQTTILGRWYVPPGRPLQPGPAAVYLHGGGMVLGSVELYDREVAAYAAEAGVPLLSVDYRRAPEHPHPHPVQDAYSGLQWLQEQAKNLAVDPTRIAVMGDSSGGGLAAAISLLERDRGTVLARQILIYPMLDDRTTVPDPALEQLATWTYDNNSVGWTALLGESAGHHDTPPSAAPARALDLAAAPSAYLEVGELDIFRDEVIQYAQRLLNAGVSTELHVYPGAPHGFERIAPTSDIAQRAHTNRVHALRAL